MHASQNRTNPSLLLAIVLAGTLAAGCSSMQNAMQKVGLGSKPAAAELTGAQEVPAVSTKATGQSTITVADDRTVSGSVLVQGMTPTAAHIHQGAAGASGPIIIPLSKKSDTEFSVPAGTKLTDAQYAAFKAGNLYVNVHSAAHPAGEIRVQMKP